MARIPEYMDGHFMEPSYYVFRCLFFFFFVLNGGLFIVDVVVPLVQNQK